MSEEKKALRARMKRIRSEANATDFEEKTIAAWRSELKTQGENYLVYRNFGSEAPTKKLIAWLKENGKKVFCPRVEGNEMVAVLDDGNYALGRYGIEEPTGEASEEKTDVCFLPMLAVDKDGNRLGYGGGYYDRFLQNRACLKIAYGYSVQVIDRVPSEKTDIPVDAILTEKGLILTGGNR